MHFHNPSMLGSPKQSAQICVHAPKRAEKEVNQLEAAQCLVTLRIAQSVPAFLNWLQALSPSTQLYQPLENLSPIVLVWTPSPTSASEARDTLQKIYPCQRWHQRCLVGQAIEYHTRHLLENLSPIV